MQTARCPICGSHECRPLYPRDLETAITSDHLVIRECRLDNRCCVSCGLIFNAAGLRGNVQAFYAASYALMMHSPSAQIQTWHAKGPKSQAEHSLDQLLGMSALKPKGHLLETGAGKGDFIETFRRHQPDWEITALEPGNAFEHLVQKGAAGETVRCGYQEYTNTGPFDVIVALGVLEHLEDPLDMLRWIHTRLTRDGMAFLRVPNFAKNPNDLFCADHLSKFTKESLGALAVHAGFCVENCNDNGIALFMLLRRTPSAPPLQNVFNSNWIVARQNETFCQNAMDCIAKARLTALERKEAFGIFGLAMGGLIAPFMLNFPPDEITAYIDENTSFHNRLIHGRPVVSPEQAQQMGILHVALTISPCYIDSVGERLSRQGMAVYRTG